MSSSRTVQRIVITHPVAPRVTRETPLSEPPAGTPKRHFVIKSRSMGLGPLSPAEKAARTRRLKLPVAAELPRTRGECIDGPRPCPWVGCRHHTWSDESKGGALKVNFPDRKPWELTTDTCTLDVADRGPQQLQTIGDVLNVSMERAQQITDEALKKLRVRLERIEELARLRPMILAALRRMVPPDA